jgi:hypothetical protein
VIINCRNQNREEKILKTFKLDIKNEKISFRFLDLVSFDSIPSFIMKSPNFIVYFCIPYFSMLILVKHQQIKTLKLLIILSEFLMLIILVIFSEISLYHISYQTEKLL